MLDLLDDRRRIPNSFQIAILRQERILVFTNYLLQAGYMISTSWTINAGTHCSNILRDLKKKKNFDKSAPISWYHGTDHGKGLPACF